jgi:O-methyltransferase domain
MTSPLPPASRLLQKLDPAAERKMRRAIEGAMRTQAIYVAATLGVADHLALGPRTADDLAERVQAHAPNLRRILRLLVTWGVFTEQEDGRFALNRTAEYLQTGHPCSLRPSAIRAGEGLWEVASHLLDAVRSGRTPHDVVRGAPFFERHAATGKEASFAWRMSASTSGLAESLAGLECLAAAGTVVDVGGGNGALLAAVLQSMSHLRGVLFDTAGTLTGAPGVLEAAGVSDRCRILAGNFFESVPAGGDVYLLSWILHDWDDEKATAILRKCREAGAKTLLVVETLLPDVAEEIGNESGDARFDPFSIDLQMLLLTGGRERSTEEYRKLLQRGGFQLARTIATASTRGSSILEAQRIR